MAIAFDSSTYLGITNPGTNLTASHTVGVGSNRILFVGFFTNATDDVTSVTYAGVGMTKISSIQAPSDRFTHLYYLLAPATGANNVSITTSTGGGAISAIATSYTGVKQSSPIDAFSTNSNTGNVTISTSVTVVASNCWTIAIAHANGGVTTTSSSGVTIRQDINTGLVLGDSNAPVSTGSNTISFTYGVAHNNAIVMASFAPFVETTNNTGMMQFFMS